MAKNGRRFLGKYDGKKRMWLREGKRFALLVLALFLLFRFVIGFSIVSGNSMRETLENGDLVIFTRINGAIARGDVVSVAIPSGEYYVKRVLALGGDIVDLRDGVLYVNGAAEQGDYLRGATYAEEGGFSYPYTVPEGTAFVLGDNREESIDSRFFGAIRLKQVRGVLRVRVGRFFVEGL